MSFSEQNRYTRILSIVIGIIVLGYLCLMMMTVSHPIIEAHSFRQTQTAISVYYLLEEGLTFDYITPVTGMPWSIPFEAPIYQLSVAIFSYISPFSLDANGRIVSAVYWFGCLIFGYKIFRLILPKSRLTALVFVLLASCSPLYMFWSHSFMIETTTLFFGLVFLYAVIRVSHEGSVLFILVATLAGTACILAKVTTWPAFVVAGGMYFLIYNWSHFFKFRLNQLSNRETQKFLIRGSLLLLSVLFSLIVGVVWIEHSDAVKLQTHFGESITSEALSGWNFGSIADRVSSRFWNETVLQRALPEALGHFWYMPFLVGIGLLLTKLNQKTYKKEVMIAAFSIVLFLLPLLIFTNLHVVHNYYQVGASLFVIASASAIIGSLLSSSTTHRIWGVFSLGGVIAGQLFVFFSGYFIRMKNPEPFINTAQHQIALLANRHVPKDTAVLTTGLDWSSHFHYYAERKGLALSMSWGDDKIQEMVDTPRLVFGDIPLGGVVQCKNTNDLKVYPEASKIISTFIDKVTVNPNETWTVIDFKECRLFYRTDI